MDTKLARGYAREFITCLPNPSVGNPEDHGFGKSENLERITGQLTRTKAIKYHDLLQAKMQGIIELSDRRKIYSLFEFLPYDIDGEPEIHLLLADINVSMSSVQTTRIGPLGMLSLHSVQRFIERTDILPTHEALALPEMVLWKCFLATAASNLEHTNGLPWFLPHDEGLWMAYSFMLENDKNMMEDIYIKLTRKKTTTKMRNRADRLTSRSAFHVKTFVDLGLLGTEQNIVREKMLKLRDEYIDVFIFSVLIMANNRIDDDSAILANRVPEALEAYYGLYLDHQAVFKNARASIENMESRNQEKEDNIDIMFEKNIASMKRWRNRRKTS